MTSEFYGISIDIRTVQIFLHGLLHLSNCLYDRDMCCNTIGKHCRHLQTNQLLNPPITTAAETAVLKCFHSFSEKIRLDI